MIHSKTQKKMTLQPYGTAAHEVLYSVSRVGINNMLLDALETLPNVQLHFGMKCLAVRPDGSATFQPVEGGEIVETGPGRLVGCDGAFSTVRACMARATRLSVSFKFIESGYMELSMPATAEGKHAMPAEALHIWSSGELMLIALPNNDGSFTCTLFGPFHVLEAVAPTGILAFFEEHFPDAVPLMPQLVGHALLRGPIALVAPFRHCRHGLKPALDTLALRSTTFYTTRLGRSPRFAAIRGISTKSFFWAMPPMA